MYVFSEYSPYDLAGNFRKGFVMRTIVSFYAMVLISMSSLGLGFSGGDGSVGNPYQISSKADLDAVNSNLSVCYILMNDIDLSSFNYTTAVIAVDTDNTNWYVFDGIPFSGSLNGNGHKIIGLTINGEANDHVGLFGRIDGHGKIENLGIVNCVINGDYCVAPLAGSNSGTITKCYATGTVTGINYFIGGLTGRNGGSIVYCYSNTAITDGNSYIGGLVGDNGSGDIENCYATGQVQALGQTRHVGGLVGDNYNGRIINCYSTGKVIGGDYGPTGALVGGSDGGNINHCYFLDTAGVNNGLGTPLSDTAMKEQQSYVGWIFNDNQTGKVGDWYIPSNSNPLCWWQYEHIYVMPYVINLPLADAQSALEESGFSIGSLIYFNSYSVSAGQVLDISAEQEALYMDTTPPIDIYVSLGTEADGSADKPFEISSKLDIDAVNNNLNAHYVLVRDIDLLGYSYTKAVIASDIDDLNFIFDGTAFAGSFNGEGHVISNLAINGMIYCGLFGKIRDNAEIKNLGVEQCYISGDGYTGALVGWNESGIIMDCYSTGIVRGIGLNDSDMVGGLVGMNDGCIINCYSSVSTIAQEEGNNYIAGLVGSNGGSIINCYATGTITGDEYTGGLVGRNRSGAYILNSYSTGSVHGRSWAVGGLVGENKGSTINCYSTGTVLSSGGCYGGLIGYNDNGNIISSYFLDSAGPNNGLGVSLSDVQMKVQSNFIGWDYVGDITDGTSEVWQMSEETGYPELAIFSEYEPIQLTGNGSKANPYLIGDAKELGAIIHHGLVHCYKLKNDIDLSGIQWSTSIIPDFYGIFDGNGFKIKNLTLTGSNFHYGLFGKINKTGEVINLGIENINISGGSYVGGLTGRNNGTIIGCYVTGEVTTTGSYIGGLVGGNIEGTISNSFSTGTITGNENIGGLVGYNESNITSCYSNGQVTGYYAVGGMVGSNDGSSTKSFSTATVTGHYSTGGLVGYNSGSVSSSYSAGTVLGTENYTGGLVGESRYGYVMTSYSTGTVSGQEYVGGLVGYNDGGMSCCYSAGMVTGTGSSYIGGLVGANEDRIFSCYFYIANGINSSGTALDNEQLQDKTSFRGFDFVGNTTDGTNDDWVIEEGYMPRLSWQNSPGFEVPLDSITTTLTGSGYSNDPFIIASKDDLMEFRNNSALRVGYYSLTSDIHLDSIPYSSAFVAEVFYGNFAGNEHVITNLIIDGGDYLGFFSKLYGDVVNLSVEDISITGSGNCVGGLVGHNYGTITACNAIGSISGSYGVGGLVGQNGDWYNDGGAIVFCNATGTVSGSGSVGGLAGSNAGTIRSCYSTGTVSGSDYVGGLVGYNDDTITFCYATDTVSGSSRVGGLVGENPGTITACYVTGSVSGSSHDIGGLAGNSSGIIEDCYATGSVGGSDCVGGMIGCMAYDGYSSCRMLNCYATGSVTGTGSEVGGLVGHNYGSTILACYATGSTRGYQYIGGLVGNNFQGRVFYCYSLGKPIGQSNVGGLCGGVVTGGNFADIGNFWDVNMSENIASTMGVGKTTTEMQTLSTFTSAGWDFVGETVNGIQDYWRMRCEGMNYPKLSWQIIPTGDLSCPDGVSIEDLSYYLDQWFMNNCSPNNNYCGGSDLNNSGNVDLSDFAIFADNWLLGI